MGIEGDRIVLDTDFVNTITNYKAGAPEDFFRRIFRALGKQPVVHPYVAKHELDTNRVAQSLIAAGDIVEIPYENFLPVSGAKRTHYIKNFRDLHRIIRENYIPRWDRPEIRPLQPDEDIFHRQAGRSFGEVHSILMAVELGIPVLFSNDKGAETASTRYAKDRLTVKSAIEVADLLRGQPEITADERKYLRKCYSHRK